MLQGSLKSHYVEKDLGCDLYLNTHPCASLGVHIASGKEIADSVSSSSSFIGLWPWLGAAWVQALPYGAY